MAAGVRLRLPGPPRRLPRRACQPEVASIIVGSALRISYAAKESVLQRLFSGFAAGWPGTGLLLLRLLTGAVPIHFGIAPACVKASPLATAVLQITGVGAGISEPAPDGIAVPGTRCSRTSRALARVGCSRGKL